MDNIEPRAHRDRSFSRVILRGLGIGLLFGFGTVVWLSFLNSTAVDRGELLFQSAMGAFAGVVISLVLHLTRSFRNRGTVQHYIAWVLATFAAVVLLAVPALISYGWRVLILCAIAGVGAGIALGLAARQI